jgi:hypothetical protein
MQEKEVYTLGDLNWFSFKDSLPFYKEQLTVWQAVVVLIDLSGANDEIVREYITEMDLMETKEYDELIKDSLSSPKHLIFAVNNSHKLVDDPDNEEPNNFILANEQISSALTALNINRMLVIDGFEHADKWFNRLKEEIVESRAKRNCRLKIVQDKNRADFDRVLVTLESVKHYLAGESKNTGRYNYEEPKQLTWQDITIEITLALDESSQYNADIKIKRDRGKVIKKGTTKTYGFQGVKRKKANMKFEILYALSPESKVEYEKLKRKPSFKKELSGLRDLLRKLIGIETDPFYPVVEGSHYEPKFKVIVTDSRISENYR